MSDFSLGSANNEGSDFMSPAGARGGGSGSLQSLFGLNSQMNNNPNSNQSLTYTAPKPPGKATAANAKQQQQASSGVAMAVAVTAYRYVNNQNVKQGKLGAAILRNVAAKDYKILMYVTKQQPVSTSQISPSFQFTVQPNNYASFSDDQRQTWTILFDNSQQLQDFAKQVCIAKFFTHPQPPETVVAQDIVQGDKQSSVAENGDSLEMKYTGWIVNKDGTLGAVFDSNHNKDKTFRFKAGRGKVIKGWELGLMGMQKGGKRFLVIPPQLAYGQKSVGNKIAPNSTLAFEVDLLRMKQGKENSSVKSAESVESLPQAVSSDTPPPPNPGIPAAESPQPIANNLAVDETVKGRTASLTDQISHQLSTDGSKNNLVSRMARMGHAMLPSGPGDTHAEPQPTAAASERTQLEYAAPVPVQVRQPTPELVAQQMYPAGAVASQTPPPQPNPPQPNLPLVQPQMQHQSPAQPPQYHQSSIPHYQQQQMQQASQTVMSHQMPHLSQNYMEQPMLTQQLPPSSDPSLYNNYSGYRQMSQYPAHSQHGYGSDMMPILVSESRQQSSELRLLQEKVDKVSGLVEEVKKNTSDSTKSDVISTSSPAMEAAAIMRNVQRIIEENEQLKQSVADKSKQIENQNEKISDLLQQNQKHVEKSNLMLEQRNDSFKESFNQSQARSLQLEQDKVGLSERLSDATSKVSELTLEVANAKQRESELKQKFKDIYLKEKERADEAEERVEELEERLKEAGEKEKQLTVSDEDTRKQVKDLGQQVTELNETNEKQSKKFEEKIKQLTIERGETEKKLREIEASYQAKMEELQNNSLRVSNESEKQTDKVTVLQSQLVAMETRLKETTTESETNEKKVSILQQRMTQMRAAYEEQSNKLEEATTEMEESKAYKEAYERIRSQAASMKEKYETRIAELQENLEEQRESSKEDSEPTQVEDVVKKIMNQIFQRVRSKVSADEDYSGAQVLKIVLEIIKSATLNLLKNGTAKKEDSEEEEEEESEEDEEEESEEEEESSGEEEQEEKKPPQSSEAVIESIEVVDESPIEDDSKDIVEESILSDGPAAPEEEKQQEEGKEDKNELENSNTNNNKEVAGDAQVSERECESSLPLNTEIAEATPVLNEDSKDLASRSVETIAEQEDTKSDCETKENDSNEEVANSDPPDNEEESKSVHSDDVAVEAPSKESNDCDTSPKEKDNDEKIVSSDCVTETTLAANENQELNSSTEVSSPTMEKTSDVSVKEATQSPLSSRSSSISDERKPPPLFDDDSEDDDDLDWFK